MSSLAISEPKDDILVMLLSFRSLENAKALKGPVATIEGIPLLYGVENTNLYGRSVIKFRLRFGICAKRNNTYQSVANSSLTCYGQRGNRGATMSDVVILKN